MPVIGIVRGRRGRHFLTSTQPMLIVISTTCSSGQCCTSRHTIVGVDVPLSAVSRISKFEKRDVSDGIFTPSLLNEERNRWQRAHQQHRLRPRLFGGGVFNGRTTTD
uniref:(northern house mosquito) hypothetical protein n=1 Tax=Culex pipiens TaxID=7175 RepID=A0A8D8CJ27_CULPI